MNRLITTLLSLLLLCTTLFGANYKVEDRSSKKVPEWVGGNQKGYFICADVSKTSLQDAKNKVIEAVKLKKLEAVAQNIDYRSLSSLKQTKIDDKLVMKDEFMNVVRVNSANIPFISATSESLIEDFYWEIRKDKKTDVLTYSYSIKYPYSQEEIDEMVKKFEEQDKKMVERYEELEFNLHNINSLEQIEEGVKGCNVLIEYFFDPTRLNGAKSLKDLYYGLYNQITVATYSEKIGTATFGLLLNGQKLSSSLRPLAKYNRDDISSVVIEAQNGNYCLKYNPEFCNEGLPYTFQIFMTIGGRRIEHNIHFTYSKNSVYIEPRGKIILTADSISNDVITSMNIELQLEASGIDGSLVISGLTFKTPALEGEIAITSPFKISNPNTTFKVKFRCEKPMKVKAGYHSSSTIKIARGEVNGYWGNQNRQINSKIALPFYCNW